jgi:hypothetical protein
MKPVTLSTLSNKQFGNFVKKFKMGEGCWEWQGHVTKNGYGRFQHDDNSRLAHRISYLEFVGELDDTLVLDHTCRNRKCVRPGHLEQVSNQENILRGSLSALRGESN